MKTLYPKSGFALVTVLILLVGLSLMGAGLTYKLIYETRLVDSWQQREVANTTAETGLESAKRWLESELDKGTVFSEGSVIKADEGSPNYCLKGFKIDEITSLKTETVFLSTELDDENFKNYKYEYYIEDITSTYNILLGNKEEDKPYFFVNTNSKYVSVFDLYTGLPSEDYLLTGEKSSINGKTIEYRGFETNHYGRAFVIDGDYLFQPEQDTYGHLDMVVYDKKTGEFSEDYPILVKSNYPQTHQGQRGLHVEIASSYFYIIGNNIYGTNGKGQRNYSHISVWDKKTGMPAKGFNIDNVAYTPEKVVGYGFWAPEASSGYVIDGNLLYLMKELDVYVVDIKNSFGEECCYASEFPQIPHRQGDPWPRGFHTGADKNHFLIDGENIFVAPDKEFIHVYNKKTGEPAEEYPVVGTALIEFDPFTGRLKKNGKSIKTRGFYAGHGIGKWQTFRSWFRIHGDNIYFSPGPHNTKIGKGYIRVFNKKTGMPSEDYPVIGTEIAQGKRYEIRGFYIGETEGNVFVIDGGNGNNNIPQKKYYRILSCGFGLNNSVSRVETVYSYASDTKNLSQIYWRELF